MVEKHYIQVLLADTGRFAYVDNPTELFKKLPTITFDLQTKDIYANLL